MYLADAFDEILQRKADEAPGGIAPLNYTWTSPDYDPAKFAEMEPSPPGTVAPQQVVITAKKIPPVPAPIQIPILQFKPVTMPTLNPWDQITARRAAMPVRSSTSSYLPWIIGGLAGLALLLTLTGGKDKPKRSATATRRAAPRTTRSAPARRPAYARRRR